MNCDNCMYQGYLENSRHRTCNHPEVRHIINDSGLLKILITAIVVMEDL